MKQVKYLSAAVLLALSGAAQADVTSTFAVVSDYDFRGFSQSGNSPAVQLSIDLGTESGLYAGVWGSNIDSGLYSYVSDDGVVSSAQTEVDVYGGFKFALGGLGLDTGLSYYTYAGASDYNYAEIYVKATISVVSAGVFYSNDFGGKATGDSGDTALYAYADLAIPVGPVSLLAHAGVSDGEGIEQAVLLGADDAYTDFALGVSYAASGFTTAFKWIAIDAGDYGSDDRIVLSISGALPLPK